MDHLKSKLQGWIWISHIRWISRYSSYLHIKCTFILPIYLSDVSAMNRCLLCIWICGCFAIKDQSEFSTQQKSISKSFNVERARESMVVRGRAFLRFRLNSFFGRQGRPLQKKSWRRWGSIPRHCDLRLTTYTTGPRCPAQPSIVWVLKLALM